MTTREMIQFLDRQPLVWLSLFVCIPLVAWLAGRLHGVRGGSKVPWRYLYALAAYLSCIPGLFAAVLMAYMIFFTNENLLDISLFFIVSIISMLLTLAVIRSSIAFQQVPGFDRLVGLMVIIAGSFAITLALQKTRIFLGFIGSITELFLVVAVVFTLMNWGVNKLLRRKNGQKADI